jgi:hypothetical protein
MRSAFFSLLILSCAVMACGQVNPHTQIRWPGSCTAAGTVYNVQSNTCVALSSISGQVTPNTQVNWPGSCTAAGTVYNVQSNTCVALSSISGQVTPNTQVNWPGSCTAAGTVYNVQSNTCVALSSISGQVTPNTQVNWPGSCTAAGTVYSLQSNTCVALSGMGGQVTPNTQINWPANCNAPGMVYSSQANACVSTGAAGNPGGASGQGQMNLGGVFAPIPGLAVDGINGWNIAGGVRYAKGWQTGGGNNGIANAASGATNQTVIADPSYATTEHGFDTTYFPASPLHYADERLGGTINYWHNPLGNVSGGFSGQFNWRQYTLGIEFAGRTDLCLYDVFPQPYTGSVGCNIMGLQANFPGYSLGNLSGVTGTNGWTVTNERVTQNVIRSAGISEADAVWQNKYGVGDNYGRYTYVYGRNGSVSGSDEATGGQATSAYEEQHFVATCTTGCTSGSTSIKTNGGAGLQGQGQYVIDTTASAGVVTGHVVGTANGILGSTSNALTLDVPVTPSTAWGTINNTDLSGVNAVLTAPYGTSKTFNVTIAGGTQFNTTEVMCFSSVFHEQVIPTAVGTPSGGVQSVTAIIRKPHVGGYVAQGGDGCKAGEDTGVTGLVPNYGPYLFEVFAVTGTNTIQAFRFQLSQNAALSYSFPTVSMSNATASSGTTVTAVVTTSTLGGGSPWTYNTIPFVLSGSSDSALNATCTNVQWQTKTQFTCTIAGLSGTHTTTTAMTATLVPPPIKIQRMAETLDVQNESLSPPQVDGTLVLEPNAIAFATNDSVTQTNHISGRWMGAKANVRMQNPYAYLNGGNFTIEGKGATGGGQGATTADILSLTNAELPSSYIGYGGSLGIPPNAINISGPYGYGLEFGTAPWNAGSLIDVITDATQVANPTYSFNLFHVGGFSMGFTPNSGAVSMTTNGGPFTFSNVSGGTNFSSQQGASNSALQLTGQPFSGGTGTTTFPYFYIDPSASGTPNNWNTNGTWLGIQTRGASSADFANWKNNSTSKFVMDSNGNITTVGTIAMPAGSTMGGVALATVQTVPDNAGSLTQTQGGTSGTQASGSLQNMVLSSMDLTNGTYWSNVGVAFTSMTGKQTDPWGGSTATQFVVAGTAPRWQNTQAVVNGQTYCMSAWIKGAAGGETMFLVLGGGQNFSFAATTSWVRYSGSLTVTGTNGFQIASTTGGATFYVAGPELTSGTCRVPLDAYSPTAGAVNATVTGTLTQQIRNNAPQTTVTCSTSGTAIFTQPEQGLSDKKVIAHLAACNGTASYTFPQPFINTPGIFASSTVASGLVTSLSTTATTITGTTSTGTIVLEDF